MYVVLLSMLRAIKKSPGSDKRYIHLFTLNCIRISQVYHLFYLHFIPNLGGNIKCIKEKLIR